MPAYTWNSKYPITTSVHFTQDRVTALVQFYTMFHGLEPSEHQIPDMPVTMLLPDTMPKRPVTEKYYNQGGNEFPARWMFKF